jgi:sortase A
MADGPSRDLPAHGSDEVAPPAPAPDSSSPTRPMLPERSPGTSGAAAGVLAKLDSLSADPRFDPDRPDPSVGPQDTTARTREPRDWRWAIGGLGRLLISVGVLMFAFVGYQLYGTGIQTAQAQNRLENEFDQLLAVAAAPVTTAPPDSTVDDTAVAASDPETTPAPSTPTTSETPSTPAPPSTVPAARLTPPPAGDPLARLTIESIDLDKIVIEGVSPADLEDGPGHFPETPLPGQYGNAAIAGHRTTHGQPFNRIDELQVGDTIVVETVVGRYTYVVTGQIIVSPNDYQLVIPTIDPTVATLTLTSCHPKFSAKQRIVVTALLDPDRSDVVTAPYVPPAGGVGAPAIIPGDDEPASTSTAPVSATSTPPTTLAAGGVDPDPSDPSDPSGVVADQSDLAFTDADASESQDLFENRWFSDPAAFPQVALWGVLLTAVAIGATAISRRAGRNWVGALVGVIPFVVVLYFWFENVNRLLPPNL